MKKLTTDLRLALGRNYFKGNLKIMRSPIESKTDEFINLWYKRDLIDSSDILLDYGFIYDEITKCYQKEDYIIRVAFNDKLKMSINLRNEPMSLFNGEVKTKTELEILFRLINLTYQKQ